MDQIECFDGVKLLRRSGDELKRRTGFNCSVFSSDAANDGELALHGAVELEEEMQCHILVWFRGFESTLMI